MINGYAFAGTADIATRFYPQTMIQRSKRARVATVRVAGNVRMIKAHNAFTAWRPRVDPPGPFPF